jgi:hypothetical protein
MLFCGSPVKNRSVKFILCFDVHMTLVSPASVGRHAALKS